jgi:hypothetical protein
MSKFYANFKTSLHNFQLNEVNISTLWLPGSLNQSRKNSQGENERNIIFRLLPVRQFSSSLVTTKIDDNDGKICFPNIDL